MRTTRRIQTLLACGIALAATFGMAMAQAADANKAQPGAAQAQGPDIILQAPDEKPGPAKPAGALPADVTVTVNIQSYGFVPIKQDWSINQLQPSTKAVINMVRNDRRMPFGDMVPRWSGSKEVELQDGYRVKIDAVYMIGAPAADIVLPKNGLSINVSYYYDQQLIDFESATVWEKTRDVKVAAPLKDVAYCSLLSKNGFEIPAEVGGYMEGFRYWVAVRDGLNNKVGNTDFDTLSNFLKPLNRKNNLMLVHVNVECDVADKSQVKPADEETSNHLERKQE